jgi:hypothetical protein
MPSDFLEYLSGNELVAYPFTEDAEGLVQHADTPVHGASATLPRDFFLDAVILMPDRFSDEVFLASIEHTGAAFEFTLVTDIDRALAVFTIPLAPLPGRTPIAFRDTASMTTVRLLTGPSFSSYLGGMAASSTDAFGTRLRFETAAVDLRPQRVDKLIVEQSVGPDVELSGQVVFVPGFNVDYSINPPTIPSGDATTQLRINAVPHGGVGQFNPCEDPKPPIDYLAFLNGVGPDEDGNLTLDPGACHRLNLEPAANLLGLYNDCEPCCSCQDYANAVEALRKMFVDLEDLRSMLVDGLIVDHNDLVLLYNDTILPKYKDLVVTGTGHIGPKPGDPSNVERNPDARNWATVSIRVNNRTCEDIDDAGLKLVTSLAYKQVIVAYEGSTVTLVNDTSGGGAAPSPVPLAAPLKKNSEAFVYLLLCVPFPGEAAGSVVATPCSGATAIGDPVTITWS